MNDKEYLEKLQSISWYPLFEAWMGNVCMLDGRVDDNLLHKCIEYASDAVSIMFEYKNKYNSEIRINYIKKHIYFINEVDKDPFYYSFNEFPTVAFLGAILALVTVQHREDEMNAIGMQDRYYEWEEYEELRKKISAVFISADKYKELKSLENIITPKRSYIAGLSEEDSDFVAAHSIHQFSSFDACIVDKNLTAQIKKLLHDHIDPVNKPQGIMKPVRAAMEANAINKPDRENFNREFGKKVPRSTFDNYTNLQNTDISFLKNKAYLNLIEQFKELV